MKEFSEEESLIIRDNQIEVSPDESLMTFKEEIIETDESILVTENVENSLPPPLNDDTSSFSKDIIPVEENPKSEIDYLNVVAPQAEVVKEEEKEEEEEEADEMQGEDGEFLINRKSILRPRKTESNSNSDDNSKKKKFKSENGKTEEKSAIIKEDNFIENEAPMNCESNSQLNSDLSLIKEESIFLEDGEIIEIKSETIEFPQDSGLFENDGGSSENILAKSDDNSSKSKDTSESETRISFNPEITKKVQKKRKRGRDVRWTKKRRRKDKNIPKKDKLDLPGQFVYGPKEAENSSPSFSDNFVVGGKRKYSDGTENSQKKNREFAVPSPSLADISMKAAIPESTATSLEVSKPNICLCRKQPQVFISGNNGAGDLYCQALDCIDDRIVGCCNRIPSQDVGLFRASERASYQMMCDVHLQRLRRHNSCPGCGLFCTQGKYLMCKSFHHFHKTCYSENESNLLFCPHCGDDSPPKLVVISINSFKDPVFLPHQRPIRNAKSAKISITRGSSLLVEEVDPTFQFPASLFDVAGSEVSSGDGASQTLHRDKLTQLLNVACRSFSKICCSNRYSYKSLYNACQMGDAEKLLKIMANGLNPNHVFEESNKQTALHLAAANGNLPVIHILLQAKAQIDVLDGEQNSPLTVAINAKHNDVVKYFIKCGANLTLRSEDGMTPLHIAAKCGNVGACFHLLNATHLPLKYIDSLDDGGWTPMVWASEFNHLEAVKFLISKGADPLIKDAEQNIALHWAAFGGSIDIVELYLNDGSDINSVNVHGDTPLHIAARQDKYSCVLLLLARGARSDIKNKNGELPRDCSESPNSDIYKGISLNMEISALLTRFQERSPRIISNDISRGKEKNQIQCVNAIDDEKEPRDYIYVSESCFTSKITVDRTINSLQSCKCLDNCGSGLCNCATISIKCWYDNDGRLRSDFNYADPPIIFECNQACQCNRITCRNRVVQNGISCRFQLFRTEGKGWGLKTLNLIPKGTYVCEYIGEIISDCEADHREDDSYLFDLDNRDGETYCIDARHYGNFARFINHSCVPNLMPVHVFVDHQDLRFPRIAFFANRDIHPNEELGYNYGEKFWVIKWNSFTCTCGEENCIYSENTIQTTLENYRKKIDENPLE